MLLDFQRIDDSSFIKGKRRIRIKNSLAKMPPEDIMTKGGKLYAVYNKDKKIWVRDVEAWSFIINSTDAELEKCAEAHKRLGEDVMVEWMWDSDSGEMDRLLKFLEKHMPTNCFHPLDENVVFANQETEREDYISFKLPYSLDSSDKCPSYDELMSTLYDPENRRKIEWAVGSIFTGDSKHIQKFIVFYGEAGSGKSTVLNIIQRLFGQKSGTDLRRYWTTFDAKELGDASKNFALEPFKNNPLIAIQHDGDLSKIEDNTRLNSLVSHEMQEINVKNEKKFPLALHSFIFMGTNTPVKITNAKSGLIRRLIDVHCSGRKVPVKRYKALMDKIYNFELGAIAQHCIDVYKELGENYYDAYIPTEMMAATNDFYDFVEHNYDHYKQENMVTLTEAWKSYQEYCEFANAYKLSYRIFRTELRNYFKTFDISAVIEGKRVRNLYSGFRAERFSSKEGTDDNAGDDNDNSPGDIYPGNNVEWLDFKEQESKFDKEYWDWAAQYEVDYGTGRGDQPERAWIKCKTRVCDIDTKRTHYVHPPENFPIVVVDFDLKDKDGAKCLPLNLEAASRFPKTYAELSKSGGGIHLYYIWTGFPIEELSSLYSEGVEVKTYKGDAAIRRKLTKCNSEDIATLSSGLPRKGVNKTYNWEGIKNEKMLRTMIEKNLNKEYHADTSSSVNYIYNLLNQAYESNIPYNVNDLRQRVLLFASKATNQSSRCINLVANMKFASKEEEEIEENLEKIGKAIDEVKSISRERSSPEKKIVIDIEIYKPGENNPGLFLVCWKILGTDLKPESVVAMINPKPHEVQELLDQFSLIGFNILEYDCHMLWAASRGDDNEQLYNLSHAMINENRQDVKSWDAKRMVECDVYEYTKAAGQGMSLKKWEIMLSGLSNYSDEELKKEGYNDDQIRAVASFRGATTHKEMDIPWNEPAPKEKWDEIVRYCKNDVLATEAVYLFTQNFYKARLFQVSLVHALHGDSISASPRDTANTLSKRTIFGANKHPQDEFNYRDLAEPVGSDRYKEYLELFGEDYQFRVWNEKGRPEYRDYIPGEVLPDGWSILPFFPGYVFDRYGKHGQKSQFMGDYGGEGGRTFSLVGMWRNVYDGDIASQYPSSIIAEVLFGKRYTKIFKELVLARIAVKHKDFEKASSYLNGALKPFLNDESYKDMAQALKIIINSIYGLTSAGFNNEFKDSRNVDNIVAKRGNLFMLVLKDEIEKMGYTVVHIKTDSIKVADADQRVKDFIVKFGREYGYEFETEAEFTKFALLNDAAYVGKLKDGSWSFKADEFKYEIIRKTLFTHKPICFDDYCRTFATKDALYLDLNEGLMDVAQQEKRFKYLSGKLFKGEIPKGFESLDDVEKEMDELDAQIREGHRLKFVGKVGQFVPVVDGVGGGYLYRVANNKRFAAAGSSIGGKKYRWLESGDVIERGLKDKIDLEYFRMLVDQAKDDICALPNANFDWFVADEVDLADAINVPEGVDEEVPF